MIDVNLAPGDDKQPDGQWTLITYRPLPNPEQAQGSLPYASIWPQTARSSTRP